MDEKQPSALSGILRSKCPKCRKGNIFVNKTVFPLGTCLRTVTECSNCGQKITGEASAPGMNYALSVIVYILCFVLYALIFGITYKDYSMYYSLIASTVIVILVQPWLMRLSKVIYLYIFTKLKS